MMLSMSMTASAREYEDVYYYVTEYRDAINFVADNGYMVGTTATTFVPKEYMTRAMLVTVLHNMAKKMSEEIWGERNYSDEIPFTDVKSTDWFYDAVRWAYANNMIAGNGAGKFSPHEYILKQDAILILYKYAKLYQMDVDRTCSLDGYTDVSSVNSYALKAVKWAVERDVFPAESDTSLAPNGYLTRAEMALLITEYGLNVEHIVYGRDDYSFTNGDEFTDGYYFMEPEHCKKLVESVERILKNYPDLMKESTDAIKAAATSGNGYYGSCYGMAVTTILDKMGKIDFNGNLASDKENMYAVILEKGSKVESAINYYHLAQYIPGFGEPMKSDEVSSELLDSIVAQCQEEKGLKLFNYTFKIGNDTLGHSVVVYDMISVDNSIYQLVAYDSRDMEQKTIYITIDTMRDECVVHAKSGNEYATQICMITDFTMFDMIDIDNDRNVEPFYGAGELQQGEVAILTAELSGNFAITNAEGATLLCEGTSLSGDMEVITSNIIYNGPDVPAQIMICVKESDRFSYKALSENMDTSISICNDVGYASVVATNVEKIQIDEENRMHLTGNEMVYQMVYDDSDKEQLEVITSDNE